jgi:hypothetical protein
MPRANDHERNHDERVAEPNAASLFAIHGADRDLSNAKAARHHFGEQVVGVAVAFPERVPANRTQGATVQCHVAALRIIDPPPQRPSREP